MKSLRSFSPAVFRVLALWGACLSAGTASGQVPKGQSSSWDNLKTLTPGQQTRVVMNNVKTYQGKFESLSDSEITLRQAEREQTLAREDIFRVSAKRGQDHQTRDVLIGTAAGAAAGLVIGRIPYFVPRNCTEGPAFGCGYPPNPHLEEVLIPVGALGGAAVGAAISTRGWHVVYHAR